MLSNILIVRHDVHILNLGMTIIYLRKALNALFYRMKTRGTFLIYAEAHNALNLNHDSVFIFANSWLPGLITNYRRVSLSVASTKFHKAHIKPFLSRNQLAAIDNVRLKPFLRSIARYRKGLVPRIPRLPAISFSVLDNFIWLNECHNLKIPSIQLCDTQSVFDKVTYPIIANQRSVPLASLLVHLFSEVCTNALLDSQLTFISYYKALKMSAIKLPRIISRSSVRKSRRKPLRKLYKRYPRLKNRRILTDKYLLMILSKCFKFRKKRKVKTKNPNKTSNVSLTKLFIKLILQQKKQKPLLMKKKKDTL